MIGCHSYDYIMTCIYDAVLPECITGRDTADPEDAKHHVSSLWKVPHSREMQTVSRS